MEALLNWGPWVTAIVVAYITGTVLEKRHFASLRRREQTYRNVTTATFAPEALLRESATGRMVYGSVVISLDYFKRFLAGLRGLVGGRVKSYEPLLDRARREALLRMKEAAVLRGFDTIVNVRLETTRMASSGRNGKGTAGIEIIAFGTAIRNKNARQPEIT